MKNSYWLVTLQTTEAEQIRTTSMTLGCPGPIFTISELTQGAAEADMSADYAILFVMEISKEQFDHMEPPVLTND